VARRERGAVAVVELLRVRAQMEILQGRLRAAQATCHAGLRLARAYGVPYSTAKLLAVLGQACRTPDRARAHFAARLDIPNRLGERLVAEQVERDLAQLDEWSA